MADDKKKRIIEAIDNGEIGDPVSAIIAIVAAVTSLGAAVSTAVGVAAFFVGLSVISTVISIGFSIYGLATGGKRKSPTFAGGGAGLSGGPRYSFGKLATTVSNEIAIPVIYGEVKVGGNIMYQSEQSSVGSESSMDRAIGICEGEVSAVTEVRINDLLLTTLAGSSSTEYVGTNGQNVDSRFSASIDGLRNTAYSAQTLQTSENLRGGNPNHTFIVQGLKVKTWNGSIWTGSTYSRNPAAAIRDFLTSTRYGVGLADGDLDDVSFGEVYDYCEETITDPDNGIQETRFQLDIALDQRMPALDMLKEMLMTFNSFLVVSGDKIKLKSEKATAVSQAFDMDSILLSTFAYELVGKDDVPNKIRMQYIDPAYNYTKILTFAEDKLDQDTRLARGMGEHIVEKDFSMMGVSRFSQASRLANFLLYMGKLSSTHCSFEVSIDALASEIGDVITVTHDVSGWTAKPFRILKIDLTEKNNLRLVLREYNESVYSDYPGSRIEIPDYGSPANPFEAPPNVSNIVLSEVGWRNNDGTHIAHVDIDWTQPSDTSYLKGYVIQASRDSGTFEDVGYAGAGDNHYRFANAQVGSDYDFKVFAVNQEDLFSTGTASSTISIVGKDAAPGAVTNFQVNQVSQSIVFTWTSPTDPDIDYFEIRIGSSWASGTLVATLLFGEEYNNANISTGTFTYHIKAVDRSGNFSTSETSKSITITNIPEQNIIVTQNEHTSWTGPKVQTFVSGTSLAIDYGFVSGNYISNVLDAGNVIQGKLTVNFTATTGGAEQWDTSPTLTWDTFDTLRWTGFETTDPDALNFEIALSDDGITYDAFETLQFADYTARYFKVKAILRRNEVTDTLLLNSMTLNVDVPDIIDTGSDVHVMTPTGTAFPFNKTFHVPPSVSVISFDTTGGFATPIMTHKNKDTFTVKLLDNNDVAVSGNIDWKAIGY